MKILYPINFITSIGADRWMGNGYKDALELLGHEVEWIQNSESISNRIKQFHPDILFIGMERLKLSDLDALVFFRSSGGKVIIYVNSVFDENAEYFKLLKNYDIADIYRGETEPEYMKDFEEKSGRKYIHTPNAAHNKLHFPTEPVEKYKHDIVFLGSNLPLKEQLFYQLLLPIQIKYNVGVYGNGWTLKDHALRTLAYASRRMGFNKLNDLASKLRVQVPPEDENKLYSSAKICINIHEARELWNQNHVILNERTFKIPACGGFEIMDFVQPEEVLRRYFTEDEMVYAKDRQDWLDKIDYYLTHDEEREVIRKKGTSRALREHLYTNRVSSLFSLI